MKKIDFKKVTAKNFLCFGEPGIEVNFSKFGNIVLVKGRNLDTARNGEHDRISSNGSGKSSIPEIIVYGLFGKTIKSPKKISHKDVMHINATKNLCVEIFWDNYKIERRRKPDSLRLWKSEEGNFDDTNELTLGGMPATQELIENIIGLNYQTFINIFIFTDDNSASFLECDTGEKRNIVENLLSLEKYRGYHDIAKSKQKDHLNNIKTIQMESDFLIKSAVDEQKNIDNLELKKKIWKSAKVNEVKEIGTQISSCEEELKQIGESNDLQEYEKTQEEIKNINEQVEKFQSLLDETRIKSDNGKKEFETIQSQKQEKEQAKKLADAEKNTLILEAKKIKTVIDKLDNLEPGVVCQHCFGEIKPENYAAIKQEHQVEIGKIKKSYSVADVKAKKIELEIVALDSDLQKSKTNYDSLKNEVTAREIKIKAAYAKLQSLMKIKAPDSSVKKAGIEEKIKILKSNAKKILDDLKDKNPYDDLISKSNDKIKQLNNAKETKEFELTNLKNLTDYYAFWSIAFGDGGIRKYIIDEIIPALNQNVNYWLQFLIDNKLEINFDNELNEKITKYPESKPLPYHVLSNGQRRRINLALSQSFAHVMSLNTGRYPSLVFLDEVTTNIDPVGVEGIYNMICELSKEKQVVVTTHDHDLLELLNGCQELNLRMQNGTSIIEK